MEPVTDLSPNAFLSKEEAASRLRVTTRTLDNYMKKRVVPFYKIGGNAVRFRICDLDAAMEKFRVTT